MAFNALAVLPGPRTSFLDHLIPLCHEWGIPLLCSDDWVYTCAQTFYPPTDLIFAPDPSSFQTILSSFKTFVTVEPCKVHPKGFQFGNFFYRGEAKTISGFHGNPTKFKEDFWIERYAHDDEVLVYGQHLVDYFKEKKVWERLKKIQIIGNLRKNFYQKHKAFFDQAASPHLFSNCEKKTLFWAPTWSFPFHDDFFFPLLGKVHSDFQVLVKLHPFMHRLYPEKIKEAKEKYASEDILFIDEIPLIYPLIQQADLFLGDYSSVVYDFLSLNRPIFLIDEEKKEWAINVNNRENMYQFFIQDDVLSEQRKKMYSYVFKR